MNTETEPNQGENDPDIAPSIRRHISMQSIFEIGCSVIAPGVWVFYKFYAGQGIGFSVMEGVVFLVSLFLATSFRTLCSVT
jgi:hypothetical protein